MIEVGSNFSEKFVQYPLTPKTFYKKVSDEIWTRIIGEQLIGDYRYTTNKILDKIKLPFIKISTCRDKDSIKSQRLLPHPSLNSYMEPSDFCEVIPRDEYVNRAWTTAINPLVSSMQLWIFEINDIDKPLEPREASLFITFLNTSCNVAERNPIIYSKELYNTDYVVDPTNPTILVCNNPMTVYGKIYKKSC